MAGTESCVGKYLGVAQMHVLLLYMAQTRARTAADDMTSLEDPAFRFEPSTPASFHAGCFLSQSDFLWVPEHSPGDPDRPPTASHVFLHVFGPVCGFSWPEPGPAGDYAWSHPSGSIAIIINLQSLCTVDSQLMKQKHMSWKQRDELKKQLVVCG